MLVLRPNRLRCLAWRMGLGKRVAGREAAKQPSTRPWAALDCSSPERIRGRRRWARGDGHGSSPGFLRTHPEQAPQALRDSPFENVAA